MQKQISIKLKKSINNSYQIFISQNLNQAEIISKLKLNNNFAIITDSKVYKLYNKQLTILFNKYKLNFKFIVFPQGEKSKNFKTFSQITEAMLQNGFDRKSTVIAFGGGVVGDIAGYVAGTYMRGIPFIQIPTTF